jgi:hypothetical protein
MTLAEVAAFLRVPEATLRYWRHLGIGPASFKSAARSATNTAPSSPGCTHNRPTAADRTPLDGPRRDASWRGQRDPAGPRWSAGNTG